LEIELKEGHGELVSCQIMDNSLWEHLSWTIINSHSKKGSTNSALTAQKAWHYLLVKLWNANPKAKQIHCKFPINKNPNLTGKHLLMAQRMALWLTQGVKGQTKRVKQDRQPSLTPTIDALANSEGIINSRIQMKLIEDGQSWRTLSKSEYALKTNRGRDYWKTVNSSYFSEMTNWENQWDFNTLLRGLIGGWIMLGNITREESMIPWTLDTVASKIDKDTAEPENPVHIKSSNKISEIGWKKPYAEYSGSINLNEVPQDFRQRVIHSILNYWISENTLIASKLAVEVQEWNLNEKIANILPESGLEHLAPKGELDNIIGIFLELRDRLEHLGFSERMKIGKGIKKGLGGEKISNGHKLVGTKRSCDFDLDKTKINGYLYELLSNSRGDRGCPFTELKLTINEKGKTTSYQYPLVVEVYLKSRKKKVIIPNPELWWDVEELGLSTSTLEEIDQLRIKSQWEKLTKKIFSSVRLHYNAKPGWEIEAFQQGNPERFARLILFYKLMSKEVPITIWGTNVADTGVAATANTAFIPFSYEHSLGYLDQLLAGLTKLTFEDTIISNLDIDFSQGQKLRYIIIDVQHNTLRKHQRSGTTEDSRVLIWVEKPDDKIITQSMRAAYIQWRVKQARNQQTAESLLQEAIKSEKHPKEYSILYVLDVYRGSSGTRLKEPTTRKLHIRFERAMDWINKNVTVNQHKATFMEWLKECLKVKIFGVASIIKKIGMDPNLSSLFKATIKTKELADKCSELLDEHSLSPNTTYSILKGLSNITRIQSKLNRAERLASDIDRLKRQLSIIIQLIDKSYELN
jgi:hypothetical protein